MNVFPAMKEVEDEPRGRRAELIMFFIDTGKERRSSERGKGKKKSEPRCSG